MGPMPAAVVTAGVHNGPLLRHRRGTRLHPGSVAPIDGSPVAASNDAAPTVSPVAIAAAAAIDDLLDVNEAHLHPGRLGHRATLGFGA